MNEDRTADALRLAERLLKQITGKAHAVRVEIERKEDGRAECWCQILDHPPRERYVANGTFFTSAERAHGWIDGVLDALCTCKGLRKIDLPVDLNKCCTEEEPESDAT